MDYKEKYEQEKRKYEAALKTAKDLLSQKNFPWCDDDVRGIFPELRESEDEKIRKEILELVSISGNGNQYEEIKDWLEKQGKHNKQYLYDIIIALWDLLDKIDTFADLQIDDTNPDNPFRKIEDITQERHKFVKSDGYNLFIENFIITNDKNFEKQGGQKIADNQNWGEEDERMKSNVLDTIQDAINDCDCDDIGTKARFALENEYNWLKSLKPQQHWKPSEEQMQALKYVVDYFGELTEHFAEYNEIKSLYDDLKKL